MANKRVAFYVHGYYPGTDDWKLMMWGNPPQSFGRTSLAIKLALASRAEGKDVTIYIGCGPIDGSPCLSELALAQAKAADYVPFGFKTRASWVARLDATCVCDTISTTTIEEIDWVAERLSAATLIQVSSPNHIERCLLSANVAKSNGKFSGVTILATASDICYEGTRPGDSVIIDPPHRADTPKVPLHVTVRGIFPFFRAPAETAFAFNEALRAFIGEWRTKLPKPKGRQLAY